MHINPTNTNAITFSDSKSHYKILDGLRGVAAVMVVVFHILEAFSEANHLKQLLNHGYLAVDFFFVLSGFVVGYAYDDRWAKMSLGSFVKRRLIRLHPLIVLGMVIGAILFYTCPSAVLYPLLPTTTLWKMLVIMLIGFTLIPIPVALDIRGWIEMHPLNGPAWSLFFEYVANILYALFVRKFSNTWLAILVFLSGCALIHLAVTSPTGDVVGGWSLQPDQFRIGITRLLYPFFAGLLLSRICKPGRVKHAFLWATALVVVVLAFPRVGGAQYLWANGLYDSLSIILIFPFIVYVGISGELKGKITTAVCTFFGDISYPLYITHYPLIYIYTAWAVNNKVALQDGWQLGIVVFVAAIALAYTSLKLYDIPVRKWLIKKYMTEKAN